MTESKNTQGNQSKRKVKKKKRKKVTKIILLFLLIFISFIGVAVGGLTFAIVQTAPDLDINAIIASDEASKIYDDKGNYIDSIITDKKRIIIKHEEMPENLLDAFVSIEDERFYNHKGIDIKRIGGALFADLKNYVQGKSGVLQGGSTITQQLLKNTLFETPGKTFEEKVKRKIQEAYLAPKLEKKVDKKDILVAYLNTVFLGGRAIGVEAAAQQYFGVSANKLTLTQCAFIAGVTQSPSINYPYSKTSKKNPDKYISRTKTVLYKMKQLNYITDQEYNNSIADLNTVKSKVTSDKEIQTLGTSIILKPSSNNDKYNFEWFSRSVVSDIKKDLKAKYNYSDDEVDNMLVNGNLKIYSTMNKDLQVLSQNILDKDEKLNRLTKKDESNSIQPQASAVLVDYHTGEVKVIIGGRGDQPASSFNRATSAKVPPGSSIKPLTVYSPAIDTKLATAATVLENSPLPEAMSKKYSSGGVAWQPQNDDKSYSGYLNMRNAIKDSVNVYAVKLEDMVGLETGVRYGEKFGITFDNADKHSMAALAMGQLTYGTNTYTMANAYGVFGNNGLYTTPRLYSKVVDKTGKAVLETKIETKQVISPQSAFIMYDLLKEPVRAGTAYKINSSYNSPITVVGKTGSSTNFKNLWFCGLTSYYSGAVWIENKYNQGISSGDAAYLFGKIMNEAVKNSPTKDISAPSGITSAAVDMISGLLPSPLSYKDPRGSQVYTELFIKDTVPTTVDNIHVEARINKLNGKIASKFTPSFLTESKVYIKRDYIPSVNLGDQAYVLPKELDPTVVTPETNTDTNNSETDNTNLPDENIDINDTLDETQNTEDKNQNISTGIRRN